MQVGPQDRAAHMLRGMQHVMMIVPVNAEIDETQHISQENRQQRTQRGKISAMRHLHFQNHDGDDDGEHGIAERLHPVFTHISSPGGEFLYENFHQMNNAAAAGNENISRKIGSSSVTE